MGTTKTRLTSHYEFVIVNNFSAIAAAGIHE